MLTILVLALAQVASAAQSLTVNGKALDAITLKTGQACTVEVVSDNSNPYSAYVGFDDRVVLGSFDQPLSMPEAGDLASITEYDVPAFYGYYVSAAGTSPPPSPGVHFVIEYEPQQVGETELKLYDPLRMTVIAKVRITVVAAQMGTVFTYQGRLMEAGNPADGQFDFEFILYNAPSYGSQLAGTVEVNDLDVIDGYFTAELDFGSDVFDGDARWLGVAVRPGVLTDPNLYVTLPERQPVTACPYALQTRGIFVDSRLNVGIGTTNPKGKLHVDGGKAKLGFRGTDITIEGQDGGDGGGLMGDNGGDGGDIILLPGEGGEPSGFGKPGRPGKVGVGTTNPSYDLDVVGNINFTDNLYQDGSLFSGGVSLWTASGPDIYFDAGNVGIGTANPGATLDVRGTIKVDQKIQAYDSGGLELATDEGTTRMFVKDDGKVGIGTANPFWKLEVANHMPGDSAASAVAADDAGGAIAAYSSTFSTFPHLADRVSLFSNSLTATGLDLRADGDTSDIRFYTGGITPSNERIRITPSGNVGIGTTNPGAKLEVKQNDWRDIVKVGTPDTSNRLILSSGPDYASVSGGQTNQNSIMISHSTGNVGIGPSLGLPQAKLQVNGDLKVKGGVTVDGAYVGTFPRPAYDSGWVPLLPNQILTCIHDLGGNVDNYVVDLQMKDTDFEDDIHNVGLGGYRYYVNDLRYFGASWRDLTSTSIVVYREKHDEYADNVRIRIWVYK